MMQDTQFYKGFTQREVEALFEIDFDTEANPQVDDEEKQRIYQELMSLEW